LIFTKSPILTGEGGLAKCSESRGENFEKITKISGNGQTSVGMSGISHQMRKSREKIAKNCKKFAKITRNDKKFTKIVRSQPVLDSD
jgi:methionine synthase II (cobalamin-independent)